uniref:hypothetical protein n=1 Tax=Pedobacter schmidteae TaxID=2201271 RepID=UPI000EAD8041|nr:hypothetical protein [Pedobacter schmidteae]
MDMDEAKRLAEKRFNPSEEDKVFQLFCNTIKTDIESGLFPDLKPYWHISKDNIDFQLQEPVPLTEDKYEIQGKGYELIPEIDINLLLNSMRPAYSEVVTDLSEFNNEGNLGYQHCKIMKHWIEKEPLIPPTIIDIPGHGNFIGDGKHRLNCAFFLGAVSVPILIPEIYLDKVRKALNL